MVKQAAMVEIPHLAKHPLRGYYKPQYGGQHACKTGVLIRDIIDLHDLS